MANKNKKITELKRVHDLKSTDLFITETTSGTRSIAFGDFITKLEQIMSCTHEYSYVITKEPTYTEPGIKTYTCSLCGKSYTEEIPALADSINPAGVIRIGTSEYATWKDSVSFETYTNQNQTVEIEGIDNETGVKEIAYHLASAGVDESGIGAVTWTPYTAPFTIEPNNNYIVYARITDNADNITYICSDGIVLDNIPPVFEGLEDGGTYPTGTVLTVEEGAVLTVNGQAVTLTDNSYTFTEVMDNCALSLTDRAGNVSSISVDVILGVAEAPEGSEHEWNYTINDKTITLKEYIGDNTDITVYGSYLINEKAYKTIITNSMFRKKSNIKTISFTDNLDTSTCTDMSEMFLGCSLLENINFSNNFNTSNVTDMSAMFLNCRALKNITLTQFDTSKVVNMGEMFCMCELLTNINFGNNFDTSKTTKMFTMFGGCKSLETLDLRTFNIENVENLYNIFSECPNMKLIMVSSEKWNIKSSCQTDNMFLNCGVSEVTYT